MNMIFGKERSHGLRERKGQSQRDREFFFFLLRERWFFFCFFNFDFLVFFFNLFLAGQA